MGNVTYDYDTAAIRREAKKIKVCRNVLENTALSKVNDVRSKLEDNFMGCTADALDESLTQIQRKLRTLNEELRSLQSALSNFADRLEEADDRVAQLLSK